MARMVGFSANHHVGVLGLGARVTGDDKDLVSALGVWNGRGLVVSPGSVPRGTGVYAESNEPANAVVFVEARPPKP